MPVPTDITAGTISITGTTVTGVGTSFLASDIRQGDLFVWVETGAGRQQPIVQTVNSNTSITLAEPWTGADVPAGSRYRLRYQWDSSRVSAQARQLIELLDNGNILALTGLTGPGVPVFDGPHSMTIKPETDFINGVAYNVQVNTLADRAAYDNQLAGFSVLVSNIGDGRSAVYSKLSNSLGDWSAPAYVTGPVGPLPVVDATVTTSAPGTSASVVDVPITGGVRLDFTLPSAEGFYNAGLYNSANGYTRDQVVRFNGSSFIALQTVPAGTNPSGAFPPVDTAYWQVIAAKGQDGTGIGDVVSPGLSLDGDEAIFTGTTGKTIRSIGQSVPTSSVSPVPINLHFGTLQGVGLSSPEQAAGFSTTVTGASVTNVINVASATGWLVGQLICYVATDGQYYSMVINSISGTVFTLNRTLPVGIANGASIYPFYSDDGHPSLHGYRTVADDALRQATELKTVVYANSDAAQWSAQGTVTLTSQTTNYYGNPGSLLSGQQSLLVQGTAANAGVNSRTVRFDQGGTYETEVVLNPGNVSGGTVAGLVTVNILAEYPDGTSGLLKTLTTTAFGNTVRLVSLRYRVRQGTKITVQLLEPTSGTWLFIAGGIRHYRLGPKLRSLNRGTHVVVGDSWVANGSIVARLQSRLPLANFINAGVGGDKVSDVLARFDTDVSSRSPNFVWASVGINDVYATTPTPVSSYVSGIDELIQRVQSLNAVPIVFDCPTGTISVSGGTVVNIARQYAISLKIADSEVGNPEFGTYLPELIPTSGAFGSITYNAIRAGSFVKYSDGSAYVSITMRTDSLSLGSATGLINVTLPFSIIGNNVITLRAFGFANNARIAYATNSDRLILYYTSGSTEIASPVSDLGTGASANTIIIGTFVRWK